VEWTCLALLDKGDSGPRCAGCWLLAADLHDDPYRTFYFVILGCRYLEHGWLEISVRSLGCRTVRGVTCGAASREGGRKEGRNGVFTEFVDSDVEGSFITARYQSKLR
jgi:hypothetical protein